MKACLYCGTEIPKPDNMHGTNYYSTRYCSRSCGYLGRRNTAAKFLARGHRDARTGCFLWAGAVNKTGYPIASFQGKMALVTRVVLEDKLGRKLSADECACHTCDVPQCIEPDHLWAGSRKENSQDSVRKGRAKSSFARGADTYNAKLSEQDVRYIMQHKGVAYAKTLAFKFGISLTTVYNIWDGKRWKHITRVEYAR